MEASPEQPPPAKPISKSWTNITKEEHRDRNDEREHCKDGHRISAHFVKAGQAAQEATTAPIWALPQPTSSCICKANLCRSKLSCPKSPLMALAPSNFGVRLFAHLWLVWARLTLVPFSKRLCTPKLGTPFFCFNIPYASSSPS